MLNSSMFGEIDPVIPTNILIASFFSALFSYDATSDTDRPGEGLSFKQDDIIHILNGSDEEWWSAALVGPTAEDGQQGLVPSKRRYMIKDTE